jgi:hypothetical protein
MYRIIADVEDTTMARVLIAALRAHGFHPLEPGDGGLPGVPRLFGAGGTPIQVLEDEADDATALAQALLQEMRDSP